MDNNKNKINSGLSGMDAESAADKRFDILDQIDLDDLRKDSSDDFLEDIFNKGVPEKRTGAGSVKDEKETVRTGESATAHSDSGALETGMSETKTFEITRKNAAHGGGASGAGNGSNRAAKTQKAAKSGVPDPAQVQKVSHTVTALLEAGKLSGAIDIVLSLRGAVRVAVKDSISVTIPLGSRDCDLRRISAGALIQSYLDNGKIIRHDIEDKLYAIIESSEPEYDDDDEIIEQTPEDILYKVTACMAFVAELTERSGNHPAEKNAMYGAADSVFDLFMADNIAEVQKKNKKRLAVLSEAIKVSGGQVSKKFAHYYEISKKGAQSPVMRFLGDALAFRVTMAVIGVLCLLSLGFYLFTRSPILTFVAKDSSVMLFVIMAEVFFTIGMALLCVIIGFGGRMRALKKTKKHPK